MAEQNSSNEAGQNRSAQPPPTKPSSVGHHASSPSSPAVRPPASPMNRQRHLSGAPAPPSPPPNPESRPQFGEAPPIADGAATVRVQPSTPRASPFSPAAAEFQPQASSPRAAQSPHPAAKTPSTPLAGTAAPFKPSKNMLGGASRWASPAQSPAVAPGKPQRSLLGGVSSHAPASGPASASPRPSLPLERSVHAPPLPAAPGSSVPQSVPLIEPSRHAATPVPTPAPTTAPIYAGAAAAVPKQPRQSILGWSTHAPSPGSLLSGSRPSSALIAPSMHAHTAGPILQQEKKKQQQQQQQQQARIQEELQRSSQQNVSLLPPHLQHASAAAAAAGTPMLAPVTQADITYMVEHSIKAPSPTALVAGGNPGPAGAPLGPRLGVRQLNPSPAAGSSGSPVPVPVPVPVPAVPAAASPRTPAPVVQPRPKRKRGKKGNPGTPSGPNTFAAGQPAHGPETREESRLSVPADMMAAEAQAALELMVVEFERVSYRPWFMSGRTEALCARALGFASLAQRDASGRLLLMGNLGLLPGLGRPWTWSKEEWKEHKGKLRYVRRGKGEKAPEADGLESDDSGSEAEEKALDAETDDKAQDAKSDEKSDEKAQAADADEWESVDSDSEAAKKNPGEAEGPATEAAPKKVLKLEHAMSGPELAEWHADKNAALEKQLSGLVELSSTRGALIKQLHAEAKQREVDVESAMKRESALLEQVDRLKRDGAHAREINAKLNAEMGAVRARSEEDEAAAAAKLARTKAEERKNAAADLASMKAKVEAEKESARKAWALERRRLEDELASVSHSEKLLRAMMVDAEAQHEASVKKLAASDDKVRAIREQVAELKRSLAYEVEAATQAKPEKATFDGMVGQLVALVRERGAALEETKDKVQQKQLELAGMQAGIDEAEEALHNQESANSELVTEVAMLKEQLAAAEVSTKSAEATANKATASLELAVKPLDEVVEILSLPTLAASLEGQFGSDDIPALSAAIKSRLEAQEQAIEAQKSEISRLREQIFGLEAATADSMESSLHKENTGNARPSSPNRSLAPMEDMATQTDDLLMSHNWTQTGVEEKKKEKKVALVDTAVQTEEVVVALVDTAVQTKDRRAVADMALQTVGRATASKGSQTLFEKVVVPAAPEAPQGRQPPMSPWRHLWHMLLWLLLLLVVQEGFGAWQVHQYWLAANSDAAGWLLCWLGEFEFRPWVPIFGALSISACSEFGR